MPNWTTGEIRLLRELYPAAPRPMVQRALPRHSWHAIMAGAHKSGLARRRRDRGVPILPYDPPPAPPEPLPLVLRNPLQQIALHHLKRAVRAQLNFAELRNEVTRTGPCGESCAALFYWEHSAPVAATGEVACSLSNGSPRTARKCFNCGRDVSFTPGGGNTSDTEKAKVSFYITGQHNNAGDTHCMIDNGYVYVMNANGKTVADYVLSTKEFPHGLAPRQAA